MYNIKTKHPLKYFTLLYTHLASWGKKTLRGHIMLRDLLTQKSVNQQMYTIFGYPWACRFRKHQFGNRSWELPLPTFFKTWFKFIKYSQNWSKLTDFQTSLGYFHVFQIVDHIRDVLTTNIVKNETFSKTSKKSIFGHFLPSSATIYEVKITFWKKLVEVAPMTYFQINVFGIYMLWGIQK
jgi:hypothetical protein